MRNRIPKALLIAENAHGCSYLANRLQGHGCDCSFATSYQEACSSLQSHGFELVLSPTKLRGITVFPLIDLLEGSTVTLFYSHAVEQGCWWLPALRHGEKCFGSSALRPREFVSVLDKVIAEIRTDCRVTDNLQQPTQQSALSILVVPSSRRESLPAGPVRAKISADVKHTVLKKLAR
jgi:DNA-binding NtrC family response regulator